MLVVLVAAVGVMIPDAPVSAHEAHVHGLARMNLVVEGQTVDIDLRMSLADVLSFEHEPETDAQRKEDRDMVSVMRKADALFVLPPDAGCRLGEVSLESDAVSDAALSPGGGRGEKEHDADHHDGHGHGDLDVEISFTCRNPEKLNGIRVGMFGAFPNLRKMEVRMVTPGGQSAATLTPESPVVRW
jgi:hypothetical protein